MIILGIDPGVTGGIAFLDTHDGLITAEDLPNVAGELDVDALIRLIQSHSPGLALIERANAMPGQGVSSTFKYGVAYGSLRTITVALRIPTVLTAARKWKAHFALDADKEKSRALAIRLWPGYGLFERKKDHGKAEAALIARYGAETQVLVGRAA